MLKIENTSKDTNKNIANIEKLQNPEIKPVDNSEQDEKIIGFFKDRKKAMQTKRTNLDKRWATFMKQYEALFTPYKDNRSSSNVPLERAIIELFVAEAIKRPTNFDFTGSIWYEFQAKILEKVWKIDWKENDRNSMIFDNEFLTAIFWTSIIFTWYKTESRIIEDFDWVDDEWQIKFSRKLWTKSNIVTENVDIRNFWIDDRATKIENAIDCVYDEYITYEEFINYRHDKTYKNLDNVWATVYKWSDDRVYVTNEERWDWETKYVKISKYWNTQLDRYYEIANDNTIIKEHPILNVSHSLPFVIRQYGKNIFSIYGYWLCEALTMFKSEINTLREMLMDAVKRSNQEIIALWWWLSFDWNQFAYNNTLMKFKWNLAWNFQQIQGTPPNQAIFSYMQSLYKDIAIFVWIDIQNILWEPQQTAYQTAVQKESSLQRLNVVFKCRDYAFERLAKLHKDNLQMFYPLKLVREMVKLDSKDNMIEKPEAKLPTIEVPKMRGKKFLKTEEKQIFEVTPESIRWDIKIDVNTDLNAITITEVEKAQKMEFFSNMANVSNAYQINPALESIIPLKKAMIDLAKLNNIDTDVAAEDEVKEKKQELYDELQNMMKWVRTQTPEEIAPQQNLAEVWAIAWVEWANIPNAPNIVPNQ